MIQVVLTLNVKYLICSKSHFFRADVVHARNGRVKVTDRAVAGVGPLATLLHLFHVLPDDLK
jgi:hypothetical protein